MHGFTYRTIFALTIKETIHLTNVNCAKLSSVHLLCHLIWNQFNVLKFMSERSRCDTQLLSLLKKHGAGEEDKFKYAVWILYEACSWPPQGTQMCCIVRHPLEMWILENGRNKGGCTRISDFGAGKRMTLQPDKLSTSKPTNATVH